MLIAMTQTTKRKINSTPTRKCCSTCEEAAVKGKAQSERTDRTATNANPRMASQVALRRRWNSTGMDAGADISRGSNDQVERRGNALLTNEAALSQSSTSLLGSPKTQPRDRSNRLLDATTSALPWLNQPWYWRKQRMTLRHTDSAPPPVQHSTPHG